MTHMSINSMTNELIRNKTAGRKRGRKKTHVTLGGRERSDVSTR